LPEEKLHIPLNTVKNANFEPFSWWLQQFCRNFSDFSTGQYQFTGGNAHRFIRPGSLTGAKNSGTINQFLLRFCVHRAGINILHIISSKCPQLISYLTE
jgi:hypothetical protein